MIIICHYFLYNDKYNRLFIQWIFKNIQLSYHFNLIEKILILFCYIFYKDKINMK